VIGAVEFQWLLFVMHFVLHLFDSEVFMDRHRQWM
jgi:hypothetical protein